MKHFAIISLSLIMSGCSSLPEPVASVTVAIKSEASEDITRKMASRETIYLELGIIPAAIYGTPLEEPLWYIDLNPDSGPSLDVASFELILSAYAEAHNADLPDNDLLVTPTQTKIARVSTFGVDAAEKSYLTGGLKDSSGNFQLFVYFDRACTISGDLDFGNEGIFRHQIKIPARGLYRLLIRGSEEYKTVTAHKSLEPIYVLLQ